MCAVNEVAGESGMDFDQYALAIKYLTSDKMLILV